ncbi:hypothetical protein A0H81_02684 [Grifola frondosa]|uniref:BZIP domain-containing protein n=1 Tax=Grifola frondosa TaxID=5627 RepID=A0A1C7MMB1_GRIFR|nr:hypothetical protein A0H81_02684 [Grifola frondosa]
MAERVRHPFLDAYFVYTSSLGTHTFFMVMLPALFFFGYAEIGRGLLLVLASGVYFSSFVKDLLCSPRPFAPPVTRLTIGNHHLEYGFPSTHSTNSVSIALYLYSILQRLRNTPIAPAVVPIIEAAAVGASTAARDAASNPLEMAGGQDVEMMISQTTYRIALCILLFYVFSIVYGRLYTAMHSFTDCIMGISLGAGIWGLHVLCGPWLDAWITHSGWIGRHPQPVDDCPCFEDAIAFVSVVLGALLARWYMLHTGYDEAFFVHVMPGSSWSTWADVSEWFIIAAIKMVLGILMIFMWRLFAKSMFHFILPPTFRLLSHLFTLPHRRFYTPATDYTTMPSEKGLRPIPSVIDLPGMVEYEIDGVGAASTARGLRNPGITGRDIKLRNGRGRADLGKGTRSEKGAPADSWLEHGTKNEEVKHYDADAYAFLSLISTTTMLVDNPLQPALSFNNPTFEDFFHLDLLAGPSNPAAGSSGSSPHSSPSSSYVALPPTPPHNPFSPSPFFNFTSWGDDDLNKLDHLPPPPATSIGFDFLGAFSAASQLSSPESSSSGSGSGGSATFSAVSDSPPIGINPQLVGTPALSKAASEFDEDEDLEDEDMPSIPEESIEPVKVGGRGKAGRKGTVQSGGVVKRAGGEKPPGILSTTSVEPDDWRPSPEEYKKMSSKEKRQLRNKISARNFRVRRKEYISTLEGDIAERDLLIDAIRTELGSTKNENVALRQEITALKRALLEGRGRADTPVLPPPAPLPSVPAAITANAIPSPSPSPAPPKSPLLIPNTQKDLPSSPGWVHVGSGVGPLERENINPVLNGVTATSLAALMGATAGKEEKAKEQQPASGFDSFTDVNPFTLKTLDAYRMQLWGNMAQQQARHSQSHSAPGHQAQFAQGPSGLASNVRPHYFAKQSPTLSALLSGKSATGAYPTPPSSPPLAHATPSSSTHGQVPTPQQAMLASIASQTLIGKLGSAFWDAFARPGGSGPLSANGKREWDADKVRRVMEGTAVVKIVDVEPQVQLQQKNEPERASAPVSPHLRPVQARQVSPGGHHHPCHMAVSDLLAESMASLSLVRK